MAFFPPELPRGVDLVHKIAHGYVDLQIGGEAFQLIFSKPMIPTLMGLLLNRYKEDKQVILCFLKEWLQTGGGAEHPL